MDYWYRKNPLNFVLVPTQNGQTAAILDFCYSVLHMKQVHPDMGISSKVTGGLGRGMCSTECL